MKILASRRRLLSDRRIYVSITAFSCPSSLSSVASKSFPSPTTAHVVYIIHAFLYNTCGQHFIQFLDVSSGLTEGCDEVERDPWRWRGRRRSRTRRYSRF